MGLPNLFQGMTFCGVCGSRMAALNKGVRGGRWYRCDRAARRGACTNTRLWAFNLVERQVCMALDDEVVRSALAADAEDLQRTIADAEAKLENLKKRRDRYREMYVEDGDVASRQKMAELRPQIEELEEQIRKLKVDAPAAFTVAERHSLVGQLTDAIHEADPKARETARFRLAQALRGYLLRLSFEPQTITMDNPWRRVEFSMKKGFVDPHESRETPFRKSKIVYDERPRPPPAPDELTAVDDAEIDAWLDFNQSTRLIAPSPFWEWFGSMHSGPVPVGG